MGVDGCRDAACAAEVRIKAAELQRRLGEPCNVMGVVRMRCIVCLGALRSTFVQHEHPTTSRDYGEATVAQNMGWDYANFEQCDSVMETDRHVDGRSFPRRRSRPDPGWLDDRERLKPGVRSVFSEHPRVTLFLVSRFGVLMFNRFLP